MRVVTRDVPGCEAVFAASDDTAGLRALIVLHSTARGPGCGGIRMWHYPTDDAALCDGVRLARGMSYKSALADLPFGGAKAVILGDPSRDKTPALLRAFGRFIESLDGHYIGAEDVGITVDDVEIMAETTRYVGGRRASGDPSPATAEGVLQGIRAALLHRRGSDHLVGVRVAIQGLGAVGSRLACLLRREGAHLVVADLCRERAEFTGRSLDARVVDPEKILREDVDVLAPCALGAVLNDDTVPNLRAEIVAGSANNQLEHARHGDALAARDVLYAPDYVINAGGIIHVAAELRSDRDRDWVRQRIESIHPRLLAIFEESQATGVPSHRVADSHAQKLLQL